MLLLIKFNPCFDGFCSKTERNLKIKRQYKLSFNPCFDGFCSKTLFSCFILCCFNFVSILVLMDFALKPSQKKNAGTRLLVSILVLMDFALKHNPQQQQPNLFCQVSILVLMDFALKRIIHFSSPLNSFGVSILVLMDFALKLISMLEKRLSNPSFNPCFDGFCSKTSNCNRLLLRISFGFNPCFDGFCSKTVRRRD